MSFSVSLHHLKLNRPCCFHRWTIYQTPPHLFPHRGGRNRALRLAHFWVLTPPHWWPVWEHLQAEEWIQFQSSMADYSWQGLTSSCQHWSYNRCFVSSTLQSLKEKTVFSSAHRERLLAATPLFSHYRSRVLLLVPVWPRSSLCFWRAKCWHIRQKVLILKLTFQLCCRLCTAGQRK